MSQIQPVRLSPSTQKEEAARAAAPPESRARATLDEKLTNASDPKIRLDESRIARGSVDRSNVQIEVKWKGQEVEPSIVSFRNQAPKPIPTS
jgi:hypothetical protein